MCNNSLCAIAGVWLFVKNNSFQLHNVNKNNFTRALFMLLLILMNVFSKLDIIYISELQNRDPELSKGSKSGQNVDHQLDGSEQHYDQDDSGISHGENGDHNDQPDDHCHGENQPSSQQCDNDKVINQLRNYDQPDDHQPAQSSDRQDLLSSQCNNDSSLDQSTDQHPVDHHPHEPYYDDDNQLADQQQGQLNDQHPVNSTNDNDQYSHRDDEDNQDNNIKSEEINEGITIANYIASYLLHYI